jgi:hypothetical protein
MTPQASIRTTSTIIFGADAVLAWGPSAAWLDEGRAPPPVRRALARPSAPITSFMELG